MMKNFFFFEVPDNFITWVLIILTITSLIISIHLIREGKTTLAILFLFLFFLFVSLLLTWIIFIGYLKSSWYITICFYTTEPDQKIYCLSKWFEFKK